MRNVIMFLALIFISAQAFAGGKIAGMVSDEKNGEAIIGATITVKGTAIGGVTDIDGKFNLTVDAGTYTLVVKYIGYQPKEVSDVIVVDNEAAQANITIAENKNTELTEVVVRTSVKKENINTLYSIQKNAVAISDGISADVIRRSPDRTTGEVLKRVSGTTIKDDKFVIVRGLSDRYNTALVDNSVLPSTEANTKAFSFDIIPAGLIDNITISKAGTPDLPGDFAGGAIQILTKEVPDKDFFSIGLSTGYNSVSTFSNFQSGAQSSTAFLGFDGSNRQLPTGGAFPSDAAATSSLNNTQNIAAIKQLPSDWQVKEHSALPAMGLQLTGGKSIRLKKSRKIGVIAALNFGHRESILPNVERDYFQYDYNDKVYKYSSNLSAMANFTYSAPKSKISLKNIYNRIYDDQFLYREGITELNSKEIKYYAFDLIQKSLFKTSLEGDHRIGTGKSKVNWVMSLAAITNDQPDQRKIAYSRYVANTNDPYYAELGTVSKVNNRFFSDLDEKIYTAGANYSTPYSLLGKNHSFKAGAGAQYRTRSFEGRFFGLVLDELKIDPLESDAIKLRPIESLYGNDLIEKNYYKLTELFDPSNTYTASSLTSYGYLMSDNKIGENLRIVWGVRAENFQLSLDSKDNSGPIEIRRNWFDLLPSANLTYALSSTTNLRASYFRAVARPEFREIAPFAYFDYELPANTYGNVDLKRTNIDNLDIRYEYYPAAGQIISVSAFYKKFTNPIEPKLYDVNSSGIERTYYNSPSAFNVGAELEIRKSLDFIGKSNFFKNLFFYTNLAYIYSRVDLSSTSNTSTVTGQVVGDDERPLAGQSPYVINVGLTYSFLKDKATATLLYNKIGRRIYIVSGQLLPSVWENPRDVFDAQFSYKISPKSDLAFNIKDIFNQYTTLYFDYSNDKKYNPEVTSIDGKGNKIQDETFQRFQTGTVFSLTYTCRF